MTQTHRLSINVWLRLAIAIALVLAMLGALAAGHSSNHAQLTKPADAAQPVSYFLKLDGLTGDSTVKGHENEIQLNSFQWADDKPGLEQTGNTGSGSGGGSGKVVVNDIHFTANVSTASPKLMLATASNNHIKEAVITVVRGNARAQDFFKLTLSDVLISSYQTGGAQGAATPVDQGTLNFGKVLEQYYPQKNDGTTSAPVEGSYDVKGGKTN